MPNKPLKCSTICPKCEWEPTYLLGRYNSDAFWTQKSQNLFTEKITHFGGIYLLHLCLKRIKLKSILSKKVFFAQRNNHYTVSEGLSLVYPIVLGFGRIETTHLLRHNGVFQHLTGLPAYHDPQTLRRFLLRMAPLSLQRLRRLHDKMLSSMMLKPSPPTGIIFDMAETSTSCTASRRWPISVTMRKARKAIIPSSRLSLRTYQRLLAWRTQAWRCAYRIMRSRLSKSIIC
jgi:hypothetical protein